jgi:Fe2+ or Zn2+ uptake regulation protein
MPRVRHTEQRQIVLRTIKFSPDPMSAAVLERKLRAAGISRATLFRALKHYVANGEIALIDDGRGTSQYVGHTYHAAIFRCQRCGKERRLNSRTLPSYVDRKMFGHQSIVTSQLIAQGLCGSCAKKFHA